MLLLFHLIFFSLSALSSFAPVHKKIHWQCELNVNLVHLLTNSASCKNNYKALNPTKAVFFYLLISTSNKEQQDKNNRAQACQIVSRAYKGLSVSYADNNYCFHLLSQKMVEIFLPDRLWVLFIYMQT